MEACWGARAATRGHSQPGGTVSSVNIAQDVTGGDGDHSGSINAGAIGTVTIGNDLTGGQSDHAGSIVASVTDIGQVTVGTIGVAASARGGTGSTYISAERNLGSLHARHIVGRETTAETSSGIQPVLTDVFITAGGDLQARSAAQALAIGSVTVDGAMSQTTIEAGYDHNLNQVNGHVIIGTVEVGKGNLLDSPVWTDNDVIAGATGATFNSTEIKGGNTAILSEVVKVIIHGNLGASTTQHEVIADYIASVTAGPGASTTPPLLAGPHNDSIAYEAPIDPDSTTEFHEIGTRLT